MNNNGKYRRKFGEPFFYKKCPRSFLLKLKNMALKIKECGMRIQAVIGAGAGAAPTAYSSSGSPPRS